MTTSTPKDQRLNVRLSADALDQIKEAAALSQQDVTSFLLGAALERARSVLAQDRLLRLSPHEISRLVRQFAESSTPPNGPSPATLRLRGAIDQHRADLDEVLGRYDARSPRLFGSVARGDARDDSDIDLLVDLAPAEENSLLRIAGLSEELSVLLGVQVDVVAAEMLRDEVSATALAEAVAV
jgi:predicted nucleotidyltransferase/uncharacterized protein (DUF1778 family)